jgi:hypothetical protein
MVLHFGELFLEKAILLHPAKIIGQVGLISLSLKVMELLLREYQRQSKRVSWFLQKTLEI